MAGGSTSTEAPGPGELEVSVFGPGYGESIVAHLGQDFWMVVDSCVDDGGAAVPLKYLEGLGVDVQRHVRLVVATHWHDDHVRGLSQTLKACASARFVCSAALNSREFLKLVTAAASRSMMASSGVDEFYKVFAVLKARRAPRTLLEPPLPASENTILWQGSMDGQQVEIRSLAPSGGALLEAQRDIARLVPGVGPKLRVSAPTPNHLAVVLWVRVGPVHFLLGADLEETPNPYTGWSAIIGQAARPRGRASAFKIPHHGSSTAHSDSVWTDLLESRPFAVLTPFIQGDIRLPSKADVVRICSLAEDSYATGRPVARRPPKRPAAVEKTLRERGRLIYAVPTSSGQVRLRRHISEDRWRVKLLDGAIPLSESYS